MKSLSITAVALVLFVQLVKSHNLILPGDEHNFYWREYHGELPTDAIAGGKDANGATTYIGIAVANLVGDSYGVYPGSIVIDQKYIEIVVNHQIQKSDLSVLILCSDIPSKFHWSRRTSWDFKGAFSPSRNPIRGGLQHNALEHKPLYIGRYQNGYETLIGKIPYAEGDTENPLYYASAEREERADDYEVLLLEP